MTPFIMITVFTGCVTPVKIFHNDFHTVHKSTLKSCYIFDIVWDVWDNTVATSNNMAGYLEFTTPHNCILS